MFIVVLYPHSAQTGSNLNVLSGFMDESWYVHTMKYFSALQATIWMNLEGITLSKITLTQKLKYYMILSYNVLEKAKLQAWKADQWLPGEVQRIRGRARSFLGTQNCPVPGSVVVVVVTIVVPPYPHGIHSKTSNGCPKLWLVLNFIYIMFYPRYTYL